MKRTETVVREEFDKEGNLLVRETTTVVEDDTKPAPAPTPYPWGPLGGGVIYGTTDVNSEPQIFNINTGGNAEDFAEQITDAVREVWKNNPKRS